MNLDVIKIVSALRSISMRQPPRETDPDRDRIAGSAWVNPLAFHTLDSNYRETTEFKDLRTDHPELREINKIIDDFNGQWGTMSDRNKRQSRTYVYAKRPDTPAVTFCTTSGGAISTGLY